MSISTANNVLKSSLAIALCLASLCSSFYISNYDILYTLLVSLLACSVLLMKNHLKFIFLYLTFYLSIGLLDISSWRGEVSVEALKVYYLFISLLLIPILIFARGYSPPIFYFARNQMLIKRVVVAHVAVSMLAVFFVYYSVGNVLQSQHLRFYIPTEIEYVIKSTLPIAGVLPFLRLRWPFIWLAVLLMPAILIGSRGTAIIAILAYLMSSMHRAGGSLNLWTLLLTQRKYIFYGIICISIISILFYARRGSGGFASADFIVQHYFYFDNIFIRAVLPFHLGFKETIGLSSMIISNNIQNDINPYPLVFADLMTVLPGEDLAAGQTLSRMFGSSQDGGLTPGLVGGVYIDFGLWGGLFFFGLGVSLVFLQASVRWSTYSIIAYGQVLTQVIHLFHRGFLKPEYVTSILIAIFYLYLCKGVRSR